MDKTLISWNLINLMESYGIKAGDLARVMGVSNNAISNLRSTRMPRLTEGTLNELLIGLNSLRPQGKPIIEPKDLIKFSLTPDEINLIMGSGVKKENKV
ncbi:helix-turn-helix domain-containing protein [Crocosphaera chwakensis]|uniref:HTH cro/C1-type domain-containing protein n=1 Tax=Crocosphaera chwakensis CCY0110 TaxID=391612 RepID=A3IXT9_9CHRO|nr:helix-turn-helix domain-containing protein [Crocosphaera chwakensis]EAZ88697.1 hypothetical protein CY0110_14230 [Crocosphaera chwakensis CCY0110]